MDLIVEIPLFLLITSKKIVNMANDSANGVLIPIGGNEDKGDKSDSIHTLEYIEDGILHHVVEQAGGKAAKIVVVTAASSIPKRVGENYLEAFDKLGCTNVHVLPIKWRSDAEKPDALKQIETADAVMFSGGDQSKIIHKIGDSSMHKILSERYRTERFVVAGTSAGAMCMSQEMISGGNNIDSFRKGAVKMTQGLGLIPSLIIDSHFIRRVRFGRLTEAVAKFPALVGIGLAEDTGLIVRNDSEFQVIGSGMVIVFDARKATHNNQQILEKGTPMTLTGLRTHILSNGDRFEMKTRKITVLPMSAAFV